MNKHVRSLAKESFAKGTPSVVKPVFEKYYKYKCWSLESSVSYPSSIGVNRFDILVIHS
jgi:hypothetical protein